MHRGHDQPGQPAAVREEVEIKSRKMRTEEWKQKEKSVKARKASRAVPPSLYVEYKSAIKLTTALFESASGCQLSETEGCLLMFRNNSVLALNKVTINNCVCFKFMGNSIEPKQ